MSILIEINQTIILILLLNIKLLMSKLNDSSPYFDFSPPSPSLHLEYELFTIDTAQHLWDMFYQDTNTFISPKFKHPSHFLKYTAYQTSYARLSENKAGCDYLFKNKEGKYIGVLHFYDLGKANYGTQEAHCTIGFAIAEAFRRSGLTTEAVKHLIQFAFEKHQMYKVLAYTEKDNTPSHAFLEKLGFQLNNEDYYYTQKYDYYELERNT
jgi:RimJ/RimL family protein N-acetyltransferase